jgi:hypothetical protein
VELLIGAGMAAIVYAAVFCGVSQTFRILNSSRENLRATQIIVSRLEGIRLEAWTTNQLFNTAFVPTNFTEYFYPQGLNSTTNEGTIYGGTVAIKVSPTMSNTPSYSSNLAQVTVTVNWTNGVSGITNVHTRTMTTYVAQYGLQNYVWSH